MTPLGPAWYAPPLASPADASSLGSMELAVASVNVNVSLPQKGI
jgi:hypothetical protein